MTSSENESTNPSPRRWVAWSVAGAVAAVVIVGAAVAVPLLRDNAAAEPSPTATTPAPTPSAPSPTPSPTATASCVVTSPEVSWTDAWELNLPDDDVPTSDAVQRITRADVDNRPHPHLFAIDEELFGVISTNDLRSVSYITVAGRDGVERWTAKVDVDGTLALLSSPATTGVQDRIIVAITHANGSGDRIRSYDLTTGQILAERSSGEAMAVTASAGWSSRASVAPLEADAFYISDRETLYRLDADTLEPVWSVSGADFGVDQFEGGVPFDVSSDTVFVGTHAVDAETGEALGWESAGDVLEAAGVTLQTPLMYDSVGPYELSGLDTSRGEACWTREVLSTAVTSDTLWVLTVDGDIQRVDPATGETLETIARTKADSLRASGRYLLAREVSEDYTKPSLYTVFEGSSLTGEMSIPSGSEMYSSDDQLIVFTGPRRGELASIAAYDEPGGSPVWQMEALDLSIEAGIVVHSVVDWNENIVDIALLH